ncbi:MAG: hypothetical protein ACREDF_11270, partial [Thermoplasmata archaeon]
MPFKFWKKEKPEKGKEEAETKEEKKEEPAPREEKGEAAEPEGKKADVKKPEGKTPLKPPQPGEVEAIVSEIHAALVNLGLTAPPTRTVFGKRVASYPGGEAAFVADYRSAPHRAVTRVLADWVGFRVPETFEPNAFLSELNLRLSSFKLTVQMKDVTW